MHPILWEVNLRCLLAECEATLGRPAGLSDLPDALLDLWQGRGVTHVWLMGLWPTGPRARRIALEHPDLRLIYDTVLPGWRPEDVAGSPYALAAYEVPETLGGRDALQRLRDRLHARGIGLLLDFVPNHVGLDHAWVREHPEWFVNAAEPRPGTFEAPSTGTAAAESKSGPTSAPRWLAHGRDPYFPPWTDTAQLDHRSRATRRALVQTLAELAGLCDGVRCDMAMLVLRSVFHQTWSGWPMPADPAEGEFWAEAIETVRRSRPGFLFVAEAYWGLEDRLRELGFDYTYDKDLYDLLVRGDGPAIQQHLLSRAPEALAAGVHFLENHDEPRAAQTLPVQRHRAAAWTVMALPGMRFLHDGQCEGARARVPVQLRRRPAEPPDPGIVRIYEEIFRILPPAGIGRGRGSLLIPRAAWPGNPSGLSFVLILWQERPDRFTLVAINHAPHPGQCRAPWPAEAVAARRWRVREHLAGWSDLRDGPTLAAEGIYLDLPEHGVQVLEFVAVD
jgi:hypothetical protein